MRATSRHSSSRRARRCEPPLQPVQADAEGRTADPAAGTSLYGAILLRLVPRHAKRRRNLVGGNVGPELTGIGTKAKPEWLQDWLRNPNHYDPETMMPHYRFDDHANRPRWPVSWSQRRTPIFLPTFISMPPRRSRSSTARRLVMENGCAQSATKSTASRSRKTSLPS